MNEIKMNETNTQELDTNKPRRTKLAENSAYAGTPGAAYVDDLLPGIGTEDAQVAEMINAGSLLVCPRCFFLHLPAFPLPLHLGAGDPPPVDACDVCAHAYGATHIWYQLTDEMLLNAREALAEARTERAMLFHELLVGASQAADTWVLSCLGDTMAGLKAASRKEQP